MLSAAPELSQSQADRGSVTNCSKFRIFILIAPPPLTNTNNNTTTNNNTIITNTIILTLQY